MSDSNPLQQYFRQPKIFISLPSKGLYYGAGSFQGDYNNVPIMAMTGMDEILMKTPDALFNGEATFKVIESCCPFITNAKLIPNIDVDSLLIAIRMATFGKTISISKICENCSYENDYDFDLENVINYYSNLRFNNEIKINDDLTINVRPMTYEQQNYFGIENFKLQKIASQAYIMEDEDEKIRKVDQVFSDLAELQITFYLASIESVRASGNIVTDQKFILDWLKNMDRDIFNIIKEKLEENKNKWQYPDQPVKCGNCSTDGTIKPVLDQSNFFV
jgi:hypothetical protein